MTKTARVISIILLTVFFLLPASKTVFAEDLINQPSITFGDLLNTIATASAEENSLQNISPDAQIALKTAQFKQLLTELENNYQKSLVEFRTKQQYLPVNDLSTYNSPASPSQGGQPTTDNLIFPTPFIPIPTLLAGVSELTTNNSQLTTFYPTPTLTDQLLIASVNNPVPINEIPPKNTYTVALLGDSMTDTLGKSLPHLKNLLQSAYPAKFFSLLNYGQGATDLESGLFRLTNTTNYLGTSYPPLLSYKPDILVVESFAYNHWSGEKYDLDRQWLDFAKVVDTVKANSPDTKIIFAASIAPNKDIFGDGVLNWPSSLKENSTLIIKAYLQNMVNFATSEHYPLADAYHPSLASDGQGMPLYISGYDHLHPSNEGAYLYSQKIAETIKNNNLIQ